MNLLIFDKEFESNHEDYIKPLTQNLKNFDAQIQTDLYDAIKIYEEDQFDIVLVDFTTLEGKTFLNTVLQKEPKQKIVTLGYELTSSASDCEQCQKEYNKRRLMKPVNPIDIYRTIIEFDTITCAYVNFFNTPKLLLKEFIENFDCFEYDEKQQMIYHNEENHDFVIKEFIEIIEELKKYEIEHQTQDDYHIKIA